MIDYTAVPYSRELDRDIARLFRQEGFERSDEYLGWIFSPPAGDALVAVARDSAANGDVVGVMSFVPTPVLASGEVLQSYIAIDLVVDPGYRGRGIFSGLAKAGVAAVADAGAAFVWGFPNSQAAHGWFNRFGWVRLGTPPLMVRPLRTGIAARKLGPMFRWFDFPLVRRPENAADVQTIERFEADADSFWADLSGRIDCAVPRDSSWLNWRTVDAPDKQYRRVGALRDGKLAALVITARQEKRGLKLLYVMEALSRTREDDPLLARLVRQELAIAAADGMDLALCWSPAAGPNRRAYRKAGFLPLPARFHPTEAHFGVRPLRSTPDLVVTEKSWYISYLDSDAL